MTRLSGMSKRDRVSVAAVTTLAVVVLVATCGDDGVSPDEDGPEGAGAAAATITAAETAAHIRFLASDELRGRETPSPGLEAAASYLAEAFRAVGLAPAGEDGTFIHRYHWGGHTGLPNVAALLGGSDPELRATYVVLSAHFDHLGVGLPDAANDSIYNGADDNASGTAAVLEAAEAFASLREPPARSILFLAVSGEEHGLRGSAAFVAHPTVPVHHVVANINLDMISRNPAREVLGVGQEFSDMEARIQAIIEANPGLRLDVLRDPVPEQRLFVRSDQLSFVRRGVPAVFFTTGLHSDYHRPSDEADRIDAAKAARVARLAFHLALDIATDPDPPRWTREGRQAVEEMLGGARF